MVEGVVKRFDRVDFLILNASVRKETAFIDMSFDEWLSLISITLDGSFHRCPFAAREARHLADRAVDLDDERRIRPRRQVQAVDVLRHQSM